MPESGGALRGLRAVILVEEQVEDLEVSVPKLWLQDAGAEVLLAGRERRAYRGKKGYEFPADLTLAEAAGQAWDLVLVPGGWAPDKLRTYREVLELVRRQDAEERPLAAICHAGWVLASAGVAKGRRLTSYHAIRDDLQHAGAAWVDERVVVDRNLVTSRQPADLPAFCRALLEQLEARARHSAASPAARR